MPYKENKNNINIIYNNNGVSNETSPVIPDGYFLLSEAAGQCSYSQEYLSLLARKGELGARKIGRNWYTNLELLRNYIEKHPAQKKGNSKGEILADQTYKKVIQQSDLNRTIGDYSKKVSVVTRTKIQNIILEIKNIFSQALLLIGNAFIVVKNIFSFSKFIKFTKTNRVLSQPSFATGVIAKQLYMQKILEPIYRLENNLAELIVLNFKFKQQRRKYINTSNYPFKHLSNKYILNNVMELIESSIDGIKFNPVIHFGSWIRVKVVFYIFSISMAFRSFFRAPVFIARHWSAVPIGCRLRVATVSSLVILLLSTTVLSQINYRFTNNLYENSLAVINNYSTELLNYSKNTVDNSTKLARQWTVETGKFWAYWKDRGTKIVINTRATGEVTVAGLSTYDFSNVIVSKALFGLDNINQASKELADNFFNNKKQKEEIKQIGECGVSFVFNNLQKIRIAQSWSLRKIEQNYLNSNDNKINPAEIGKSFVTILQVMNNQLSDKNSLLSKSNDYFSKIAQNSIVNLTGWPKGRINNKQIVFIVKNVSARGNKVDLAFKNYLGSSDTTTEMLSDKLGRLGKLGKLGKMALDKTSREWEQSRKYLDKLFGRAQNTLGETYLALLRVLNLQPAYYTDFGTSKTLLGIGDDPLDLQRGASGLKDKGLAVVPLAEKTDSERDDLAKRIQQTFSDEVDVMPDKDTASGIIKPIDEAISFEEYMYVVVPIVGNSEISD